MSEEIDVTVIVPVYRCEETLRKCLDSVLSQVGSIRLECIVVNDGSPDNEQVIIDEYVSNYPELFRAVKKENGGLADARNFGSRLARGRYVGYVDSDDYVEPNMFDELFKAAERLSADVAISKYYHHREDGRSTVQSNLGWPSNEVRTGGDFLLSQRSMVVWNKIYRRELVAKFPQPSRWFEDVAWTPVIMSNTDRVVFVDSVHYHYVRRPGSIASSHQDPRTLDGVGSVEYALEHSNPNRFNEVHYMALRRLLFESEVRPAYADKYIQFAHSVLQRNPNNPYLVSDDHLYLKLFDCFDKNWGPIPKTIFHDFPSNVASTNGAPTPLANLGHFDVSFVGIDPTSNSWLSDTFGDIELDAPTASALLGLKCIIEEGGVYIDRHCRAHSAIAPLLLAEGFLATDSSGKIATHVFGARKNHNIFVEWLEEATKRLRQNEKDGFRRSLESVVQRSKRSGSSRNALGASRVVIHKPTVLTSFDSATSIIEFKGNLNLSESAGPNEGEIILDELKCAQDRIAKLNRELASFKRINAEQKKELKRLKGSIRWRLIWRLRFVERFSGAIRLISQLNSIRKKLRDPAVTSRARYAKLLSRIAINPNLVLFESLYGRGISSSPFALFLAWMAREDFKDYHFIWAVEDEMSIRFPIPGPIPDNVSFVQRGSNDYYKALAEAKYLVNDVSFFFDFTKRPGQIYINTWHSITVKSLGYDLPGKRLDQKNVVRNFLSADYLVAANDFVAEDTFLRAHHLNGIYRGEILKTGHPRSDLTLSGNLSDILSELRSLGIPIDQKQPTILFAPTWRGEKVNEPKDNISLYVETCRKLKQNFPSCNILIRPHQITYSFLPINPPEGVYVVPPSVDANRLFLTVDLLITDYSSIFFDFLVTNRPVAFFVHDIEEYKVSRGIYFELDELPGPSARTIPELIGEVKSLLEPESIPHHHYETVKSWACPWDDGMVSSRVLCKVLHQGVREGESEYVSRRRVGIYPGRLNGGRLNARAVNLARSLQESGLDVSILVDDSSNPKFQYTVGMLINSGIRVIGRSPHAIFSKSELVVQAIERNFGSNWLSRKCLKAAFAREWRRCFGEAIFDYVITLDSSDYLFSRLLSEHSFASKIIWRDEVSPKTLPWGADLDSFFKVASIEEVLHFVNGDLN